MELTSDLEDEITSISQAKRMLLGLCLVHRGYVAEGLREISITVELPQDNYTKFSGLLLLYFGFIACGLLDHALRALEEAEHIDEDRVIEMLSSSTEPLRKGLKRNTLSPNIRSMKETLHFYHVRSVELSMSAVQFLVQRKITDVICNLTSMFDLIVNLMQVSTPEPFTNVKIILKQLEQDWEATHLPSDDYEKKKRSQWRKRPLINAKDLKNNIVFKTVQGYSEFLEGNYESSFFHFSDSLEMASSEKFDVKDRHTLKTLLSSSILRSITVLAIQAFVRIPSHSTLKNLMHCDHLISEITQWSQDMHTRREHQSGKLEPFFTTLGFLYIDKSILEATKVTSSEIEPLPEFLEEAIRKLVIASTLKYCDDESVGDIFDTIVTCCLLQGGYHIKIIWFFRFLADYFRVATGLNQVCSDGFELPEFIKTLNKSARMRATKIEKLRWTLSTEDKTLLISEGGIDPRMVCIPPCHIVSNEGHLTLRQFERWYSAIEITEKMRKTDHLVDLWVKSYTDYHDYLPHHIINFMENNIDVVIN
ncbi:CYFA0S27e00804g1_1 [Cyberlindnera fabianii]|uniref:CYFA0S27e00804g1_1 n=1 Tax=Cyberlindnera fabianii TaxID=36022 RepID=A0A061BGI8_CYBFA|nr:CYFA0S27e00804g1_1 [Cyberlindnera fabianii]